MAQKKTNIKIKHRKFNLYNKKKSKARQALAVILTIVVACALGVVGYGIGKPVLDYIRGSGQSSSDGSSDSSGGSDSSESGGLLSSDVSGNDGTGEASESVSDSSQSDSSDAALPPEDGTMYFLPENAASSSASLNSAIAAAKSAGHTTVVVTLKDSSGSILYKTNIASVKDSDSVAGTLTAAQISDIITKAGLVPAAKISTLMDSKNPGATGGSYELAGGDGYWLDNRKEKGGKTWLSPFKNNTSTFLKNITSELADAGFKYIICANTQYPAFHSVDITTYLNDLPLTDTSKRTAALWSVLDAIKTTAEGKDSKMWVQISSASILAEDRNCTDAEICGNAAKLKDSRIIIEYTSSGSAADAYKNAKDFVVKAKSTLNGAEMSVVIKGFSGSALSDVQRAFDEADIPVLSQ